MSVEQATPVRMSLRAVVPWFVAFLAFVGLDTWTTWVGYYNGYHEGNPVVVLLWDLGGPEALVAAKLFAMALTAVLAPQIPYVSRRHWAWLIAVLGLLAGLSNLVAYAQYADGFSNVWLWRCYC